MTFVKLASLIFISVDLKKKNITNLKMMRINKLNVQTSICSIFSHQTYSFHQSRSSYSSHYSNLKFKYQNFQWIVYFIYKKKKRRSIKVQQ